MIGNNLDSNAQGCVAVRNMSSWSIGGDSLQSKAWQFSLTIDISVPTSISG